MGIKHYCDICERDLPDSDYEVYEIHIHPKLATRSINHEYTDNKVKANSLKKEVCPDCAKDVINYILSA